MDPCCRNRVTAVKISNGRIQPVLTSRIEVPETNSERVFIFIAVSKTVIRSGVTAKGTAKLLDTASDPLYTRVLGKSRCGKNSEKNKNQVCRLVRQCVNLSKALRWQKYT